MIRTAERPDSYDTDSYEMVVVGGGPGGYAAALYGAAAGLSVAVVEKDRVGGTCLHRGCVPAKQFLETASVARTVAGAKDFGIQASQPTVDFAAAQARKARVVQALWKGLDGLMSRRRIEVIQGTGTLLADRVVRVNETGQEVTGRNVVLASGSVPRTIPGFEIDGQLVMSSDELLDLTSLPATVAVIGGGAIGCEFASMMSDLGTQVTVLEALPKLLPGCDRDIVEVVARSFRRRGIDVHLGVAVTGHAPGEASGETTVHYGEGESVAVDAVVVAVGRRPLTEGLLADGTGVALDARGFVAIDDHQRTGASGVYAVGDVVATPQLAHVGFAEAIVAVRDMLGEPVVPVDHSKVPWCIYSHPEVAFAGLSEEAAVEAGYDIVVSKDPLGGNSRARILGETDGLVKVIAERGADGRAGRLLGVHMVGPWVTEQLGQGYLALNWEATPDEVGHFVQPHPTLSEAFGETVMAMTGRGLHLG
ncbi:MAG: dihydrolipoyl dehydrogenase [Acidimicrobiales bacterium]